MGRIREFDVDQAVDQAMDLFRRRGYTETSPQGLLGELPIESGSFYAAFGSKERLCLRAQHYSALQADELVRILEHGTEIRPAVRQVLVAMIEADLADPSRGRLVVDTPAEGGGGRPTADTLPQRCGKSSHRLEEPSSGRSRGVSCLGARPRPSRPAS
ncbi:TetR/AcrR family transcriptional regulator [Streptomyces sp. NPDC001070]